MQVVKRNGELQDIDFEKIHWRIKSMCSKPEILDFQSKQRPDDYEICRNLPELKHADVDTITKKTIEGLYNNIPTTDIDQLSAEVAQEMCTLHPDNSTLATRILVSNIHKNTLEILFKRFKNRTRDEIKNNLFNLTMRALYFNRDKHGETSPLVAPYMTAIADKYSEKIESMIDYSRDFVNHDYLGIKMLEKSYLFRVYDMDGIDDNMVIVERPSVSDMRIAIGIVCAPDPCPPIYERKDVLEFIHAHPQVVKEKYRSEQHLEDLYLSEEPHRHKSIDTKIFKLKYWSHKLQEDIDNIQLSDYQWKRIKEIYDGMSTGKFTPATPTRFAAGTLRPQGSSCFLIAMESDSLDGIYNTLHKQSQISKHAGGIGMWCHNIRSTGSYIAGTNGISNGLKPMLKVFDSSTIYVDQGGGKRAGTIAMYLEPWHADIVDFLRLKRKKGNDADRARRLFYALWIPDEFFRCLRQGKEWYLFDPSVCPKLYDSYDEGWSKTYLSDEYINQNKDKFLFTYRYRKYVRQGKYEKKISCESLIEEIVETGKDSALPYMLCKDACNRKSNQKNLGVIKSSNLCVAPETKILTNKGYQTISKLRDQEVTIWNGFEWSDVTVRKTGENQEMVKVSLSDGAELICTPYHKFYINKKRYGCSHDKALNNEKYTEIVQAQNLKFGDKLVKFTYPVLEEGTEEFFQPYTHGFFCGDGTLLGKSNYCGKHKYYDHGVNIPKTEDKCQAMVGVGRKLIYLYGDKKLLKDKLMFDNEYENTNRTVLQLSPHLASKFSVPINANKTTKLEWFAGYCDADGTIARNGTNESLQVACIHKDFLLKVKLMLSTLGIHSKVTLSQKERITKLPDGKDGLKDYKSKASYKLLIASVNLQKLYSLGFRTYRLKFEIRNPNRDATRFVKVVKVEKLNYLSDTYCFTESIKHTGIFNGILTGQCQEIVIYSDKNETGTCNLSSICLNEFIRPYQDVDNPHFKYNVSLNNTPEYYTFDWEKFSDTVRMVQNNIDRLIDFNFYPTECAKRSNLRHRPMGIGVQGEADMMAMLRLKWNSKEANRLRFHIFERMYYECLKASIELSKKYGSYSSFSTSPTSKGLLQYDLWLSEGRKLPFPLLLDWDELKKDIKLYGLRNSLFIAPMPTASTSGIMGNSPSIEPFNSLVYIRKIGAGDFTMVNKYLVRDLMELGLWNPQLSDKILENDGSIQNILEIPKKIRDIYLTAYDLEPKDIIDAAYTRAWWVDQSQSLNLWFENLTKRALTSAWIRGFQRGLKSLSYYCRTRPATKAQKVQISKEKKEERIPGVCYRDDPDCLACGS